MLVGDAWIVVDLENISLGSTIRFYDAGHLAFHQQTKATEWVVDDEMYGFVTGLIEKAQNSNQLPKLELIGCDIDSSSYSEAFGWIMDRMQDGNMITLNQLFESYDPEIHCAEFMSGVLRCASSRKRLLPAWLPALRKVTDALGEKLIGMDPDKMEAELAAEEKPDHLGSLFDRQILNVHPDLVRN